MKTLAHALRDRQGSSSLEFAIVATVFFVALFGALDFGRLLFFQSAFASAVGASGRELLVGADPATLNQLILDRMPFGAADRLTASVADVTENGVDYRRLQATYAFEFILDTLFDYEVTLSEELRVPN